MSFSAATGNGRYDRGGYDDDTGRFDDRDRGRRESFGRGDVDGPRGVDRRRSPAPPHRRSRSPRDRMDRYDSRPPRRDDHGTPGGYARGSNIDRYIPQGGPMPSYQQNIQDPNKFDFVVPFPYFNDWVHQQAKLGLLQPLAPDTKLQPLTKEDVQARYDAYKDATNARLKKDFVNAHMNEQWFREKYYPGEREAVRRKIVEFRKTRWPDWKAKLDEGLFDNIDNDGRVIAHLAEKKDETNAGDGDDGEDAVVPTLDIEVRDETIYKPTLLIKTISPTVSRSQLEEQLCADIDGFSFISLSDPNPLKKYHRIGFIILDPSAPIVDQTTIEKLGERKIHDETYGDFTCHIGIHTAPKELKRKVLNSSMSLPENLRKQAEYIEKAARKLEEELGEGYEGWDMLMERVRMLVQQMKAEEMEEDPEEGEDSEDEAEDLATIKKTIDIGIEYLRRVFSFCIYCMAEADSMHELTRKCPGGHTRRPAPKDESSIDQRSTNWIRVWCEKADLFIDPHSADLKKFGGRPIGEILEEEMQKNAKLEDEGKYRCKIQTCSKLFKGETFWRKHVEKRHKDWSDKIELEASLVNNYALDPGRVMPPKPDHMILQQQQRTSGFQPMLPQPFPGHPAMQQPPFPFFPNQPPPYMPLPHSPSQRRDGGPPSVGGPGPIRRRDGGGRGGAQNGGGFRQAPYGANRGRRSPRGGRGGGERDGGRALRSYMDLDATKDTTKLEELDY